MNLRLFFKLFFFLQYVYDNIPVSQLLDEFFVFLKILQLFICK